MDGTAEDGTAELSKKVDGTAESHDPQNKNDMDAAGAAELDNVFVSNVGK